MALTSGVAAIMACGCLVRDEDGPDRVITPGPSHVDVHTPDVNVTQPRPNVNIETHTQPSSTTTGSTTTTGGE
jgi:hypothetical protein